MAYKQIQLQRRKKSLGVPAGYREIWNYKGRWDERKIRKGLWIFKFGATKSRKSRSLGNFGVGTTGRWKIVAIQDIKKVGRGKYKTLMRGFKKPVFFKVRRPKNSY